MNNVNHNGYHGASVLRVCLVSGVALSFCWLCGCATPDARNPSGTTIFHPDAADGLGGSFIESTDIRTIASQLSGSMLTTPELAARTPPVRIAIAPIRNSTRHIIDKDLFSKRLRLELNRSSNNRVRFFSQGMGQGVRREILNNQDEQRWADIVQEVAETVVSSKVVQEAGRPLRVAVIPVKNTNLTGMNANSFTARIRSRISALSEGKVVFLARDANGKAISQILAENDLKNLGAVLNEGGAAKVAGVDYFLGGEFVADSLIEEKRSSTLVSSAGTSEDDPGVVHMKTQVKESNPNVSTYLNIMLIDGATGDIPVERFIQVTRKMRSGLANADFILTGEISALSKAAAGGDRSDYVLMSFQLVDPDTNELIWEDAYETKKKTNKSVIYK